MRISFLSETVKGLRDELEKPYKAGELRKVLRISVLIMAAKRQTMTEIMAPWKISQQTIENW
jgi:hypothetical protein